VADFDPNDAFQPFQSIFGDFFGASRTRSKDLTITIELTLLEAAHGGSKEVELPRVVRCEPCHWRGGEEGATFQVCASCGGKGGTETTTGHLKTSTRCKSCGGKGGKWSRVCASCGGRGEIVETKKATVQIPPGIEAGSMLRLAGQGNDLGEGAGNALLLVEVAAHPSLWRVGADLHARVEVDPETQKNGGAVRVPWLTGEARVRAPAGMIADVVVRLPGWGCVRMGSPYAPPPTDESPYRGSATTARGDLVVTLTTRAVVDAPRTPEVAQPSPAQPSPAEPVGASPRPFAALLAAFAIVSAIAWLWSR
jgi:DnaJ-class molecular chaperone